MYGLATLFVYVLWRTRVALNNGWWRERLHSKRFVEWTVGSKNKKQCEEEKKQVLSGMYYLVLSSQTKLVVDKIMLCR
jgi:hypothetical protein